MECGETQLRFTLAAVDDSVPFSLETSRSVFYKTDEPHGLPHDPFKACVAPRPIAWITSKNPDGNVNLAPYSFFNALTSDPPTVVIGFNGYHAHGGEKDSLSNIKATRGFVVNMVPYELKDAMNLTSGPHAHDVDELALAGLTTEPAELVDAPRVREAPIHLECEFLQEIELPCTLENSINRSVIGRVLGVHIRDDVLKDGLVDLDRIKPLARLGYQEYTVVDTIFKMTRPGT